MCIEAEVDIARLWLREWDMLEGEGGHVSRKVYMWKMYMYINCAAV